MTSAGKCPLNWVYVGAGSPQQRWCLTTSGPGFPNRLEKGPLFSEKLQPRSYRGVRPLSGFPLSYRSRRTVSAHGPTETRGNGSAGGQSSNKTQCLQGRISGGPSGMGSAPNLSTGLRPAGQPSSLSSSSREENEQ